MLSLRLQEQRLSFILIPLNYSDQDMNTDLLSEVPETK